MLMKQRQLHAAISNAMTIEEPLNEVWNITLSLSSGLASSGASASARNEVVPSRAARYHTASRRADRGCDPRATNRSSWRPSSLPLWRQPVLSARHGLRRIQHRGSCQVAFPVEPAWFTLCVDTLVVLARKSALLDEELCTPIPFLPSPARSG